MTRVRGNRRVTHEHQQSPSPSQLIEIAARHEIEPLLQGDGFGFCSIFAAVNGLRLALQDQAPLSKARAKRLLLTGLGMLDKYGGLLEVAESGMDIAPWHRLVRKLAKEASTEKLVVELERPELGRKATIADVFSWIESSLAEQKPVLVCLNGGLNHYSVLAGIDSAKLHLFDSCGFRFVKRSCCGIDEKFHHLTPKALLRIAVRRR